MASNENENDSKNGCITPTRRNISEEILSKPSPSNKVRRKLFFGDEEEDDSSTVQRKKRSLWARIELVNAKENERNRWIEKYNFDPVSNTPLQGNYEWEICGQTTQPR